MRIARERRWFLTCILLASAVVAQADESLKTAYSAILRGDYDAGRASIGRLLETGGSEQQLAQVDHWLDAFQAVVDSREELRRQTFEWNVEQCRGQLEQAKQLLEQGENQLAWKKIYLTLSFAAQASRYAASPEEYAASPLIQELRPKVLAAAKEFADSQRWVKAHSFYVLLQRIDEKDEEIKSLRERAARHARLELIYETSDDVERRMRDVTADLLDTTLELIYRNYYDEPDFKKMAQGALDNLEALCSTTKLYQGDDASNEFNSVADPMAREYFLGKLEAERQNVQQQSAYTYNDVKRLYRKIKGENAKSVSVSEELLIVEFLEGALSELDEFTSIVWPADAAEFDKMMVGNFVGVGIQLGIDELSGRLKVVTPLENSPALEAGVQPEDLIVAVNGETTKDWTTDKAVREITGPEGTEVTLTIHRSGVGSIPFTLKRRPIELTTIRGVNRTGKDLGNRWNFMLDEEAGIAYIRLTNFNPGSTDELEDALGDARTQGMRGLILDLRYNPGGLLDVAVGTVSTFLQNGTVVRTDGRREQEHLLPTLGEADYPALPLVVLVNEHSASASEILAGALQDHDRAMVLGERTFGKGSVQRVYSLQGSVFGRSNSAARLKLTTALYYLPNGKSPHRKPDAEEWGVDPDWKIELTPKEFAKVVERQGQAFIIHNEDEAEKEIDEEAREKELAALKADDSEQSDEDDLLSEEDLKLLRSDPYDAPDVDPQLETALLQLRVKLAANVPWPRQLAKNTEEESGG